MDKTDTSYKDQVTELTEQLEDGIRNMMNSDDYKQYLKVMSKFTNYSFNNSMLIAMQCPEASYVAGYKSWQANFDRNVNKGEKAIKIIAPAPYKTQREQDKVGADGKPVLGKDGTPVKEKVEVTIPAYKAINVWDVSQTSGKDLPEIVHQLDGSVEGYKDLIEAMQRYSPALISFEDTHSGANGFFRPADNTIVVQSGMSELQTAKTTLHETAHALLHNKDADKSIAPDHHTKEVQAESVAYTVSQYYGLDTSEYSFGYIAGWSTGKDLKELQSSMETIRQAARDMISGINQKLDAIHREREPLQDASLSVDPAEDVHREQPSIGEALSHPGRSR